MQEYESKINLQYGLPDLGNRILESLGKAGVDLRSLNREDLRSFDEFHLRARGATRELAHLARVHEDMRVLDIGSGVGGPARTLAAEFGCRVTGLELSREYCRAAQLLTHKVNLSSQIRFLHGNALEMPFKNARFDLVWMQHVSMNIEPKTILLREIRRVLRRDGVLALYEIFSTSNFPLTYPLPWANDPSISFMIRPRDFHHLLGQIGFKISIWQDLTPELLAWAEAALAPKSPATPAPTGLDLVIGPDYAKKTANLLYDLKAGRMAVIRSVCQRIQPPQT